MTSANDGQAKSILQRPLHAPLDVPDLCRLDYRGRAMEASLSVLDCPLRLQQWHLRCQLRQRDRVVGKAVITLGESNKR